MSKNGVCALLVLCLTVRAWSSQSSRVMPVPGDPLPGRGDVSRTVLTYNELFSDANPSSPVTDSAFALPANAAMPRERFEGRLELSRPESSGGFAKVFEIINITGDAD